MVTMTMTMTMMMMMMGFTIDKKQPPLKLLNIIQTNISGTIGDCVTVSTQVKHDKYKNKAFMPSLSPCSSVNIQLRQTPSHFRQDVPHVSFDLNFFFFFLAEDSNQTFYIYFFLGGKGAASAFNIIA